MIIFADISYLLSHTYTGTNSDILANCTVDMTNDGSTLDDTNQIITIGSSGMFSSGTSISISYNNDPIEGYVNTTIRCENNVSWTEVVFNVSLREDIFEPDLLATQAAYATNVPAEFTVSVSTGSHVQVQLILFISYVYEILC